MKHSPTIRQVLNELNIHSFLEYMDSIKKWESFENRVFGGGQDKIDALRTAVVDYYYDFTRSQQLEGQYISINPADSTSILLDGTLENYMCIFPKRTLIETSSLCSYIDVTPHNGESYDMPPNDFFRNFFRYERLLDRKIAHLYPVKNDIEANNGVTAITDSSMIIRLKNVAEISREGAFSTIVQRSDIFYLAFPWLYNANTDIFLEICDKYPAEFENLAITIEKISMASNNAETNLHDSVIQDLKEALVNIQIAFDKKRSNLKARGITTTLGIALTCVPFVLPEFFSNFNPEIFKTVIGSASILGSKSLLSSFFELRNENKENPFWVLWKWKQSTM